MARSKILVDRITIRELCQSVGAPTGEAAIQRMRRRLKRRQAKSEIPFLFQESLSGRPGAYMVSLPALKEACPDLFDRREQAAESLRAYVQRIDDALLELRARDRALGVRIRELKGELADLRALLETVIRRHSPSAPFAKG